MLERKKLFAGIFAALLALNLYGTKVEAATDAETEEARMWGGFRDKISCTVEGSVANTTTATKETVIIREVPVYRYPFLFIWDDWYHWGRWHHHHHHVWHRPARPPRPHISRPPVHRPPRPHIGKPIPRPPRPLRPHISRPPVHRPPRPPVYFVTVEQLKTLLLKIHIDAVIHTELDALQDLPYLTTVSAEF